jgi:hypothetical protein
MALTKLDIVEQIQDPVLASPRINPLRSQKPYLKLLRGRSRPVMMYW